MTRGAHIVGGVALGIALLALPEPGPAAELYSRYEGQAVGDDGRALADALVLVAPADDPSALAPLYADAAGTQPLANPLTADANGLYGFYVEAGVYHLEILAGGFSDVLIDVVIEDPGHTRRLVGADTGPPLTLVERSEQSTSGNAALVLERREASGAVDGGRWALHVNQGPEEAPAEIRWLYNVDWDEPAGATGPLMTSDVAYMMTASADPGTGCGEQQTRFEYSVAPAGAAGDPAQWRRLLESGVASVATRGTFQTNDPVPTENTGAAMIDSPLVVGDSAIVEHASLVAPRINWNLYHKSAPAGVLQELVRNRICQDEEEPSCAPSMQRGNGEVGEPCSTGPDCESGCCEQEGSGDCKPSLSPGQVVLAVGDGGNLVAAPTGSSPAERDASTYVRKGNNRRITSLLAVGKALVKIDPGESVSPGDLLVSAGGCPTTEEAGCAMVDNGQPEPRRVIGVALEHANATLNGHVAILRLAR